jgi:hypothetical protein
MEEVSEMVDFSVSLIVSLTDEVRDVYYCAPHQRRCAVRYSLLLVVGVFAWPSITLADPLTQNKVSEQLSTRV